MRHALKLHPDSRCEAVTRVDVEIARSGVGGLLLHYFLSGRMSGLVLPPATVPTRADELWRHTCFEAFLRASTGEAYYEFNFAPSGQWAIYRFDRYRSGMRVATEIDAPCIDMQSHDAGFEMEVLLTLADLPNESAWRIGLSAVIEETNGRKSYWVLAHPRGKPDFHHSDCFALELPAISQP